MPETPIEPRRGYLRIFMFILFAAILLPRIYKIIKFLDIGETVIPHSPGPCHIVSGADIGSEDIDIVPGTDIALISAGLQFETRFPGRKGNILYFDFNKPSAGAKPITIKGFDKGLLNLNPHGISIYSNKGKVILLVINHGEEGGDVVERFNVDIKSYTITHIDSIQDPEGFRSLNDLTATGEKTFYFSNFKYFAPGTMMGTLETYGQIRWASVGYFDGEKTHICDSNKLLINGISQSPDGKYIYLANIGDDEIITYQRQQDNSLKIVKQTKVDSIPDNMYVNPQTGDIWLGCQPVGWKLVHYLSDQATRTCPSQVLRIKTENGLPTDTIHEIYADTGKNISASTVAVYHKNVLLIGSISHNAVYCNVKHLD